MDSLDIDLFTSVFLPFSGRPVDTIKYVRNEGDLDKVVLVFGGDSLIVEVDPNLDTVRIFQKPYEQLSQLQAGLEDATKTWAKYIGKNFGWGWVTVNQQNFPDGVLLSFDGIEPNVLLNVKASTLNVSEIRPE